MSNIGIDFREDREPATWQWWQSRRWIYNLALLIAGPCAFLLYAMVAARSDPEVEITLFTMFFPGIGYLLVMALANVCYLLGPLAEWGIKPQNPKRFRSLCFSLGLWFSVALPFSIPALIVGIDWSSK